MTLSVSSRTSTAVASSWSPTGPGCPGWAGVTQADWDSAQWQRVNCVKNITQLRAVMGDLLDDRFYDDLASGPGRARDDVDARAAADAQHDGARPPTRPMPAARPRLHRRLLRRPGAPLHAPGLLRPPHRLAVTPPRHRATRSTSTTCGWPRGSRTATPPRCSPSCCPTCPQYCGHCTRMDLVGNSTPQVAKLKFDLKPVDRYAAMLDYLRASPGVRDVVVSGGDVANMPWKNLEAFVDQLLDIDNIRDIRLATKALMGLPQHWFAERRRRGRGPRARPRPAPRGVSLAIHTHVNSAQSVTPLGRRAPRRRCSTPACATCATRACSCAASTTRPSSCSTCASRCTTAPRSRRTTSTCAT